MGLTSNAAAGSGVDARAFVGAMFSRAFRFKPGTHMSFYDLISQVHKLHTVNVLQRVSKYLHFYFTGARIENDVSYFMKVLLVFPRTVGNIFVIDGRKAFLYTCFI